MTTEEEDLAEEYELLIHSDGWNEGDHPRDKIGQFSAAGGGSGYGSGKSSEEKISEGEAKARAKFPGPKEIAHDPEKRTAWYREQTAKMKAQRGELKEKTKAVKQSIKKKKDEAVRVKRYEHFDLAIAPLSSPKQTPEGFWRVDGRVARTGVQHYTDGSGARHGEFRSDEEVRKSLPGFARAPLTNTHPPQMVTPENAKQYVTGAVGEAKLHADGWVTAPITVYTRDAIDAMKAGRIQLSVGYTCEIADESGECNGISYTHCQKNIAVNHVALVDSARAGPDARVRLDDGDAVADSDSALRESGNLDVGSKIKDIEMTHTLKVDSLTFDVDSPNVQPAVDKAIADARKDAEDKAAAADKALVDLKREYSELKAKHDTLVEANDAMKKCGECKGSGKLDGTKCDGCSGKGEYEMKSDAWDRAVARAAKVRGALLAEAGKILGANEKLDDKTDLEIKKLVVAKVYPKAKLDGADEVYIRARYDAAIETEAAKPSPVDVARTVSAPTVNVNDAASDPDTARQRMIERNRLALVKKGA